MLIDCDTCSVRGKACDGCVVSLLFGATPAGGDGDHPAGAGGEHPAADRALAGGQHPSADRALAGGDAAERRAVDVLLAAGFEVTVLSREDRSHLRLVPARRGDHHAA